MFTLQERIRLVISRELLLLGIPCQRPANTHRDVPQVADADTAVLPLDIRQWLSFRYDAIEKVPDMIHDRVELSHPRGPGEIILIIQAKRIARLGLTRQVFHSLP